VKTASSDIPGLLIVIPLGDKKPVITINARKEDTGDEDI
jgi:hypothetical protein